MWQLCTYLKYGNVLESTISGLLSESNCLQPEYYLPPINKPNF